MGTEKYNEIAENRNNHPGAPSPDAMRYSTEEIERVMQFTRDELKNRGLSSDIARNLLNTVIISLEIRGVENVGRARTYVEKAREGVAGDKGAELILQLSDPEAVAEFDTHIAAYNSDLDRIRREKDVEAVTLFVRRAIEILEKYNA